MLVTLKLNNAVLDDFSSLVSFPFLTMLRLESVIYPGDEFVQTFLSYCPVLECLVVFQSLNDNVIVFTVRVPSLKRLFLSKSSERDDDADGFVIEAPFLKLLAIHNHNRGYCIIEKEMPEIVEADIIAGHWSVSNTLGSITSLQRLWLSLQDSKDMYPVGSVFRSLKRLTVCTCEAKWMNVLMRVLRDSPNLKSLVLQPCHISRVDKPRPSWTEPSLVPKCLLSSLENFKWMLYKGTEEERQVAAFIVRNGKRLKNINIDKGL